MGRVCVTMPNFAINYLCNLLTDVDEIWHNDAYWSPAPDVRFIFFKFSTILYGGRAAILRIDKLFKYIL